VTYFGALIFDLLKRCNLVQYSIKICHQVIGNHVLYRTVTFSFRSSVTSEALNVISVGLQLLRRVRSLRTIY